MVRGSKNTVSMHTLSLFLLFTLSMLVNVGSFKFMPSWAPVHSRSAETAEVRSNYNTYSKSHSVHASHPYHPKYEAPSSLSMSSVSTGGTSSRPSQPPRSAGFIISPSSRGSENELLILQNFNQIQYGEKLKFGVIGTQDLSSNHKQMVELLSYALILSGNHVYTSAGGVNGTNLAVIQGALRYVKTSIEKSATYTSIENHFICSVKCYL